MHATRIIESRMEMAIPVPGAGIMTDKKKPFAPIELGRMARH